jgi:hypothetical protein
LLICLELVYCGQGLVVEVTDEAMITCEIMESFSSNNNKSAVAHLVLPQNCWEWCMWSDFCYSLAVEIPAWGLVESGAR